MGRNWAIVVGINNYDNLQPLKYAKKDAEGMAAWFKDEAEFDAVLLFTEDSPSIDQLDIYKAASPIPTLPIHARFLRFLNAQFERPLLKPEDNLWFFFAGHGKRYADQDYLMFLDSDPLAVDRTAISVNYVTQRLRRSGADNIVLFLDACRDEGSRAGLGVGEQRHQGVVTFYSCSANQQSWEIDELQHGAFTYTILEGLRLQGEMNCATVERLEQYLRHQVPQINTRYNKPTQNPSLQAEPPYKIYFILLEQVARLIDVEPLKYQASQAENRGDLSLAKQLWMRVLVVSSGDLEAVEAIERIALRQRRIPKFTSSISEPRSIQEIENFAPIGDLRTQESTPSSRINRKQFLMWAGLGGAGLVTAVVGHEIFKNQTSTVELTNQPMAISVAAPKDTPPTEGAPKALGMPLWTVEFETVKVDERGEIVNPSSKIAKFFKEDLGNDVTLEMVSIPAGSFKMGSPPGEKGRYENEGPQHTVNVPAFFLGKFEVTQEQYKQVMGSNPSHFKGAKRPVEQVSWNDAMEFCNKLSQKTGRKYRLPSEAEWEYAARAGTTTPFHFGETMTSNLANYIGGYTYASEPEGQYRQKTTEVGTFPPNCFGLYDMHGNVSEWCQDTWYKSYKGAPSDGSAWVNNDNQYRLLRGGAWSDAATYCRSARRYGELPGPRNLTTDRVGFRVSVIA